MKGLSRLKFKFSAFHLGLLIVALTFAFMVNQEMKKLAGPDEYERGFLATLERTIFDFRIVQRGPRAASGTVGILAVDEKSIAKFGRWPFPRSSYVEAFKNLKAAGVQWIGLDVLFSEPENILLSDALEPMEGILSRSLSPENVLNPQQFVTGVLELLNKSPGDAALGAAIQDFDNIIQAWAMVPPQMATDIEQDWDSARAALNRSLLMNDSGGHQLASQNLFPIVNTETIRGQAPLMGFITNQAVDADGIYRRTQLAEEVESVDENKQIHKNYLPSLSLALAAKFTNRKVTIVPESFRHEITLSAENKAPIKIPTIDENFTVLLNHYGEHFDEQGETTPTQISLADAAENNLPEKIPPVLILGSTTLGIDDKRPSPINPLANGVEHHVAATENIINQDFLYRQNSSFVTEAFLLIISGLLLCVLLRRSNALFSLIFLIFTHVLIEILYSSYLLPRGQILHLGIFHIQNALIFITMILFKYFVEEHEKRRVKSAFQHYLNPEVINQLMSDPDKLKLGGDKQDLTVFFSDVRGFTSMSEILDPVILTKLLNEYFTPMTQIVLESRGLLDKYIGDAMMAVWGAPIYIPDHADRALDSALKMLEKLDELREYWKKNKLPPLDIGCGINTGPMVVGNMGSTLRFDYTVLGDSVNLGARLEGITKEYGVRIICSQFTKDSLKKPDNFLLRELDQIKVKGKNEPVRIFEVMQLQSHASTKQRSIKELFEAGLAYYRNKDFTRSMEAMLKVLQLSPQDGPAGVFLERCEHFVNNPPAQEWDGVWTMRTK